jgi:Ca2+-binding RTX toxin-like protein
METVIYDAAQKFGLSSMSVTTETIAYNTSLLGSVTKYYFSTPQATIGIPTTLTQEYTSGVKVVWTNLVYSDSTHATFSGLHTYVISTNELLTSNLGSASFVVGQLSDPNTIYSGADRIIGNSFNNTVRGYGGNDIIDGGGGVDTAVYSGIRADYTISFSSSAACSVADKIANRDGADILANGERLKFSDTNLALDIAPTQNAGSVYMLYKAAFNRPSDAGGMGYWISLKDGGANIVTNIAQGFVNSAEFIAKYGANPSNSSYVNNLYQNVLGRAGEAGGVAYWISEMDAGRVNKAQALVQFATLAEGAGIVAPLIANGIPYTEYVG